jgi:hypothetical protein
MPGQERHQADDDVTAWLQGAEDRIESGRAKPSWLTDSVMTSMAIGYAVDAGNDVPPRVYSVLMVVGYALRMGVHRYATPRALDVSKIDPGAVERLASFPRDPDTGTVMDEDLVGEDEALMAPIVALACDAAESSAEFAHVVSVEPAFWNAVASEATTGLPWVFKRDGLIRRPRDLDPSVAENFLRYGFVFRCLDEALGIGVTEAERD